MNMWRHKRFSQHFLEAMQKQSISHDTSLFVIIYDIVSDRWVSLLCPFYELTKPRGHKIALFISSESLVIIRFQIFLERIPWQSKQKGTYDSNFISHLRRFVWIEWITMSQGK